MILTGTTTGQPYVFAGAEEEEEAASAVNGMIARTLGSVTITSPPLFGRETARPIAASIMEHSDGDAPGYGGESHFGYSEEKKAKWVFTGRELLEMPLTKPQCLLEPILQTTGFSLLIGESDVGKTWLALSVLLAVASREPEWLGYAVTPAHGRAILISTEDSEYNLAGRFRTLQESFGAEKWRDNVRVLIADDKTNAEIVAELQKMIRDEPVDLIILDCFGDSFDGRDANSQAETRRWFKNFVGLSKECHIMILHHKGKRLADKTPNKDHALGSQAIEAKARTVLDLTEIDGTFYLSILKCKTSRDVKKESKLLTFDEERLVFRDTGETIIRSQIALEQESPINWKPLFGDKDRMKQTPLAKALMETAGMGRSTAFVKIQKALKRGDLKPDNFGNILNPGSGQVTEPNAQELSSPSESPNDLDGLDSKETISSVQESEPSVGDLRPFMDIGSLYGRRELQARANLTAKELREAIQKGLLEKWLIPRGNKFERIAEVAESSLSSLDGLDNRTEE